MAAPVPDTSWMMAKWRQGANISLLTGSRSGVIVADVDPRHDGSLETLWELGWPRETVIARTGGGGWHVYARCPKDGLASVDAYAPGIELKANGKQVIAPPSVYWTGARYEWLEGHSPWDRAVAALPDVVLAGMRERPAVAIGGQPDRDNPYALAYTLDETARIAAALFRKALRKVEDGEGRNNTAFWLGRQLDSLGLTRAEVVKIVVAFGEAVNDG